MQAKVAWIDTVALPDYPWDMTELALPAGSLQAALIAFSEGADAVYLGMKSFSARKMAVNFTLEDLAKLRQAALAQNKKIYVTVNTLADDSQLAELFNTLRQIAFIGCDGVIVQDLGLVHIIRRQFPSLALHGSTQLAVHTIEGVREMERLGFERVVLARELTVEEIKRIRKACPSVQLKVFIHGALCYSFSGLCMASEQLCGRSANCGACAQICRNHFTVSADSEVGAALSPLGETAQDGWFFSMSDMKAGSLAKELDELGIESLKVEGRMKSPAYSGLAARYYRSILDGRQEDEDADEALSIVFGRRQTKGWLGDYGRNGQDFSPRKTTTLGSVSYPGHRGLKAAVIVLVKDEKAVIRLERTISIHDGLMYFLKSGKGPLEAVKFGVFQLQDQMGRNITEATAGMTVQVNLKSGYAPPRTGELLYLVSRHDHNPPLANETLPPVKKNVDMHLVISDSRITLSGGGEEASYDIPISLAKKPQDTLENLRTILAQSDTSYFSLGLLSVENNTGLELSNLFMPLSALKAMRRNWYELLDRNLAQFFTSAEPVQPMADKVAMEPLPPRSLLATAQKLSFLDLKLLRQKIERGEPALQLLFNFENLYYLPLSPVMFNEEQFFTDLDFIVAKLREEGVLDQVRIGLNNIGQVPYFRETQIACFFDVYLYLANCEAAKLALSLGLNLKGGYLWMERHEGDFTTWPFVPTVVEPCFTPPLFISRSCFRHDSLMLSCEQCPHRGSWYVKGGKDRYRVLVEDCITYVVKD